jgi:trans-aconitate methyltransferase
MQQPWSAQNYAENGRFVADLAGGVFELLNPRQGERILDLGCGDGALTKKLAEAGASVVGVDSSADMIAAATLLGLDCRVISAEHLPFDGEFDAVFSNAALHWMHDQDAVLAGVARALKPGGRFVAEMGGHGNIAAIEVALRAVFDRNGLAAEKLETNYFPTPAAYGALLERHGFRVEQIGLVPRPTALPASGMRGWLETFRRGVLAELSAEMRETVLAETVELLRPSLCDEAGNWTADYVRLRFKSERQLKAG